MYVYNVCIHFNVCFPLNWIIKHNYVEAIFYTDQYRFIVLYIVCIIQGHINSGRVMDPVKLLKVPLTKFIHYFTSWAVHEKLHINYFPNQILMRRCSCPETLVLPDPT